MPASGNDILNESEIFYIACGGLCAMKMGKHKYSRLERVTTLGGPTDGGEGENPVEAS